MPHSSPDTPRDKLRSLSHTDNISNISNISTRNGLDTEIEDYPDDDFYTDVDYAGALDRRWRPIAAIAAGVLVLAVIATALIVNGGDSASTTATVGPPPTRPVIATPRSTLPTAPPNTSLPRETVTTVTPPPTALPTTSPSSLPPTTAPQAVAPAPPLTNPRTIVYRVTGTKQLIDFVSIVYTDARGLPHTDFNVSLPWSKTIVLNPGVELKSVVATSLGGHLNCAITDAEGQTVVASTNGTMIATCTR